MLFLHSVYRGATCMHILPFSCIDLLKFSCLLLAISPFFLGVLIRKIRPLLISSAFLPSRVLRKPFRPCDTLA